MTIAQLLDELGTPQTGVAVARNDEIIRRSELEHETIAEGDRIEIIKAVAGG
jgi:sulfur carrier protein